VLAEGPDAGIEIVWPAVFVEALHDRRLGQHRIAAHLVEPRPRSAAAEHKDS
jgi:hypothetical protein